MDSRPAQLLIGLIELYIDTGIPVGSKALSDYLDLDFSSATVRGELQKLTATGFLFQPHTSAGRVPTDRGYRYYVDHLLAARLPATEQKRISAALKVLYNEYQILARAKARLLAQLSQAVAISIVLPTQWQEAGMGSLLAALDDNDLATAREVSQLVDAISHHARDISTIAPATTTVYIGHENPLLSAEHTSLLIISQSTGPTTSLLILAGPKRMPYQRNLALLNYVGRLS